MSHWKSASPKKSWTSCMFFSVSLGSCSEKPKVWLGLAHPQEENIKCPAQIASRTLPCKFFTSETIVRKLAAKGRRSKYNNPTPKHNDLMKITPKNVKIQSRCSDLMKMMPKSLKNVVKMQPISSYFVSWWIWRLNGCHFKDKWSSPIIFINKWNHLTIIFLFLIIIGWTAPEFAY